MSNLGTVSSTLIEKLLVDFVGQMSGTGSLMGSYESTERLLASILPGDKVGESLTTQIYLLEQPPTGQTLEESVEQFAFLRKVVEDEDYITGFGLQRALKAGAIDKVTFGRNETGAQRFHGWVDQILAAEDDKLQALFEG